MIVELRPSIQRSEVGAIKKRSERILLLGTAERNERNSEQHSEEPFFFRRNDDELTIYMKTP